MDQTHNIGALLNAGEVPTAEEAKHLIQLGTFAASLFSRHLHGLRASRDHNVGAASGDWASHVSGRLSASTGTRWDEPIGLAGQLLTDTWSGGYWQVSETGLRRGYREFEQIDLETLELFEDEPTIEEEAFEAAPRRRRESSWPRPKRGIFGPRRARRRSPMQRALGRADQAQATAPGSRAGARKAKPRQMFLRDGAPVSLEVIEAFRAGGLEMLDQLALDPADFAAPPSPARERVMTPGRAAMSAMVAPAVLDGLIIDERTPALASALTWAETAFGFEPNRGGPSLSLTERRVAQLMGSGGLAGVLEQLDRAQESRRPYAFFDSVDGDFLSLEPEVSETALVAAQTASETAQQAQTQAEARARVATRQAARAAERAAQLERRASEAEASRAPRPPQAAQAPTASSAGRARPQTTPETTPAPTPASRPLSAAPQRAEQMAQAMESALGVRMSAPSREAARQRLSAAAGDSRTTFSSLSQLVTPAVGERRAVRAYTEGVFPEHLTRTSQPLAAMRRSATPPAATSAQRVAPSSLGARPAVEPSAGGAPAESRPLGWQPRSISARADSAGFATPASVAPSVAYGPDGVARPRTHRSSLSAPRVELLGLPSLIGAHGASPSAMVASADHPVLPSSIAAVRFGGAAGAPGTPFGAPERPMTQILDASGQPLVAGPAPGSGAAPGSQPPGGIVVGQPFVAGQPLSVWRPTLGGPTTPGTRPSDGRGEAPTSALGPALARRWRLAADFGPQLPVGASLSASERIAGHIALEHRDVDVAFAPAFRPMVASGEGRSMYMADTSPAIDGVTWISMESRDPVGEDMAAASDALSMRGGGSAARRMGLSVVPEGRVATMVPATSALELTSVDGGRRFAAVAEAFAPVAVMPEPTGAPVSAAARRAPEREGLVMPRAAAPAPAAAPAGAVRPVQTRRGAERRSRKLSESSGFVSRSALEADVARMSAAATSSMEMAESITPSLGYGAYGRIRSRRRLVSLMKKPQRSSLFAKKPQEQAPAPARPAERSSLFQAGAAASAAAQAPAPTSAAAPSAVGATLPTAPRAQVTPVAGVPGVYEVGPRPQLVPFVVPAAAQVAQPGAAPATTPFITMDATAPFIPVAAAPVVPDVADLGHIQQQRVAAETEARRVHVSLERPVSTAREALAVSSFFAPGGALFGGEATPSALSPIGRRPTRTRVSGPTDDMAIAGATPSAPRAEQQALTFSGRLGLSLGLPADAPVARSLALASTTAPEFFRAVQGGGMPWLQPSAPVVGAFRPGLDISLAAGGGIGVEPGLSIGMASRPSLADGLSTPSLSWLADADAVSQVSQMSPVRRAEVARTLRMAGWTEPELSMVSLAPAVPVAAEDLAAADVSELPRGGRAERGTRSLFAAAAAATTQLAAPPSGRTLPSAAPTPAASAAAPSAPAVTAETTAAAAPVAPVATIRTPLVAPTALETAHAVTGQRFARNLGRILTGTEALGAPSRTASSPTIAAAAPTFMPLLADRASDGYFGGLAPERAGAARTRPDLRLAVAELTTLAERHSIVSDTPVSPQLRERLVKTLSTLSRVEWAREIAVTDAAIGNFGPSADLEFITTALAETPEASEPGRAAALGRSVGPMMRAAGLAGEGAERAALAVAASPTDAPVQLSATGEPVATPGGIEPATARTVAETAVLTSLTASSPEALSKVLELPALSRLVERGGAITAEVEGVGAVTGPASVVETFVRALSASPDRAALIASVVAPSGSGEINLWSPSVRAIVETFGRGVGSPRARAMRLGGPDAEMTQLAFAEDDAATGLEARLAAALDTTASGPAGVARLFTTPAAQPSERAPAAQRAARAAEVAQPLTLAGVIAPERMLPGMRAPELATGEVEALSIGSGAVERFEQSRLAGGPTPVAALAGETAEMDFVSTLPPELSEEERAAAVEHALSEERAGAARTRQAAQARIDKALASGGPIRRLLSLVDKSGGRSLSAAGLKPEHVSGLLRRIDAVRSTSLMQRGEVGDFVMGWLGRVDGSRTGMDIGFEVSPGELAKYFRTTADALRASGERRFGLGAEPRPMGVSAVAGDSPIDARILVEGTGAEESVRRAVESTREVEGARAAYAERAADRARMETVQAQTASTRDRSRLRRVISEAQRSQDQTGSARHGASSAMRDLNWSFVKTGIARETPHADLGSMASSVMDAPAASRVPMPLVAPAVKAVAQTALRSPTTEPSPGSGTGGGMRDTGGGGPSSAPSRGLSEDETEALVERIVHRVRLLQELERERIGVLKWA